MTISGISTNVQSLLENSGYFADNGSAKAVIAHPPDDGNDLIGYPAAAHYYVNTQSDYATVSQNRRIIEYMVELYIISDTSTSSATEFTEAYELVDNILNLFDQSIDLSDADLSLAKACDIMRPVPGELQRISTNEGTGLLMPIKLFCEADVTFR